MSEITAFIGHSFTDDDKDVVRQFLGFFDSVKNMGIGFSWEHAAPAEPKVLSEKVLKLMENKNLFIGICTVKERAIDPDKLRKTFRKKSLMANKDDFASKTSDWIIQEIGIAIGKAMDVMVLIEDGLRSPGGLQGNLEYISFSRNEPSKSFNKILEMLTSLTPKKTIGYVSPVEAEKEEEKELTKEKVDKLEPTADWKRKDYERELFHAIIKDDNVQEQKIIDDYFECEEGQKDTDKESFKALKFYYIQIIGKGANVEELKRLSSDHPDSGGIAFYLGSAYKEYKDFNKAAEQFARSAELAKNDKERLFRICTAAVARCKNGDNDAEVWLLNQARGFVSSVDDGELEVISTLKTINKIQNNDDKYLAYAERSLDIHPDDHDLRFELAYKYLNLKNNEFALFHFMIIPDTDQTSTIWNNIGVANARLKIDGKAVVAYRKSEELSGTLAMSNLAHIFIEAGFLKEAEELCSQAVKIEDYDKLVGTAISRIKETREREDQAQKEILDNTEQRRKFYVDFGRQCINKPLDSQEGIWIGPECELNINIKGHRFIAKGSYEEKQSLSGILSPQAFGGLIKQEDKLVKINIRYEGVVTGLGIEFKQFIDNEGKQSSLLSALSADRPSKEGLMIISEDIKSIRVYEKGTKESEKFYEFRRK